MQVLIVCLKYYFRTRETLFKNDGHYCGSNVVRLPVEYHCAFTLRFHGYQGTL